MARSIERIGPYEVIGELASGGMATTYLARKTGEVGFERLVVIKRVHPHLLKEPNLRDMLADEARVAASMRHPNVVPVEDVVNASGELCLVMPYVESLSLGALVDAARRAGERLPPAVVSRILLDVLAGLDAAHEAKDLRGEPLEIVHRDVSPRNVLVGTDGRARLIDFGVAKAARRITQTGSGIMKGTIAYMAPEQLRRRELDRRADVFAAGVVLHEAITGERLFDGHDEADVLIGVLADEIPRLSEGALGLSPAIDEVLEAALCRDPEERFASAAAFADALERALPPAPAREVSAILARLGAVEIERRREAVRVFLDQPRVEAAENKPRRRSSSRSILMMASAAALAGGGFLALFAMRRAAPSPAHANAGVEARVASARDAAGIAGMNAPGEEAPGERGPVPTAATAEARPSSGSASGSARPKAPAPRWDLHANPYRAGEIGDNRR
ncbi:serine/threonine-protein kinase [Polyangium fumosum]|uniref:non-specific serine/threonine protein kinase n=1 Tax=Polyangium fumosum TaxID=889272 RepID=A0A4U1J2M5_9BACT|nr:serine/threonine-protein kinase [Polyangium fumosum]TKD01335.1 serine/threonine protein kinase [Polyangium fumosum]